MGTLNENINQANSDFNAIKDKIVECGVEVADGTPTYQLRNKVIEVYNKGKQDEYNAFWDVFQDHGNRTYYYVAFSYPPSAGGGWSDSTYNPKYPIIGEGTYGLYGVFRNQTAITNIKVPVIAKTSSIEGCFQNANGIITIPLLVLEVPVTAGVNAFLGCTKLTNLNIECVGSGCFATDLSFQYDGALSKASITSIVNALSTTTNGLTLTLSGAAVNKAFETAPGANDGGASAEWTALKATRANWFYTLL